MKKKKREMSDSVSDAILETIFTIVFSAIGFIVCLGISKIFSVKLDNFDLNSFILVGIAFFVVIVAAVCIVNKFIKRMKDRNK